MTSSDNQGRENELPVVGKGDAEYQNTEKEEERIAIISKASISGYKLEAGRDQAAAHVGYGQRMRHVRKDISRWLGPE